MKWKLDLQLMRDITGIIDHNHFMGFAGPNHCCWDTMILQSICLWLLRLLLSCKLKSQYEKLWLVGLKHSTWEWSKIRRKQQLQSKAFGVTIWSILSSKLHVHFTIWFLQAKYDMLWLRFPRLSLLILTGSLFSSKKI